MMVGNKSGMSNQEEIQELREQLYRLVGILLGEESENAGFVRLRKELGSRLDRDETEEKKS
jgi:hypothetical protein